MTAGTKSGPVTVGIYGRSNLHIVTVGSKQSGSHMPGKCFTITFIWDWEDTSSVDLEGISGKTSWPNSTVCKSDCTYWCLLGRLERPLRQSSGSGKMVTCSEEVSYQLLGAYCCLSISEYWNLQKEPTFVSLRQYVCNVFNQEVRLTLSPSQFSNAICLMDGSSKEMVLVCNLLHGVSQCNSRLSVEECGSIHSVDIGKTLFSFNCQYASTCFHTQKWDSQLQMYVFPNLKI